MNDGAVAAPAGSAGPARAARSWRSARDHEAAWAGAAILGLATLQVLRLVGQGSSLNTVWAEDGAVFLFGAKRQGILSSLTTTYEGYLHTLPRLLAGLTTIFPFGDAAVVMTVLAALVTAMLAVFVFYATRRWIPSPLVRSVLAVAVVLLPAARDEVVGNLANLQWPLLFACFWALLANDESPPLRRSSEVVACVAALSSPLSLAFAPIAIWNLWRRRWAGLDHVAVVFLGASAVQVFAVLASRGIRTLDGQPVRDVVTLTDRFGSRVVGGVVWWPSTSDWWVSGAIGIAVFAALATWMAFRVARHQKHAWLAALLVGYSVVLFVAPAMKSGVPSRYAYTPGLMLLSAAAVAVVGVVPAKRRTIRAVAVVFALAWCASFPASEYRVSGPSWSAAVDRAERACARAANAVFPLAPYDAGHNPWRVVRIPCS